MPYRIYTTDVKEILGAYAIRITSESDTEIGCRCPFHDDKHPSFFINKTTGLWHCHTENMSGNTVSLINKLTEKYGDLLPKEYKQYEGNFDVTKTNLKRLLKSSPEADKIRLKPAVKVKSVIPQDYVPFTDPSQCPAELLKRMPFTDIVKYKLGYQKSVGFNRVVIPIFFCNIPVSYSVRVYKYYIGKYYRFGEPDYTGPKYLHAKGVKILNYMFGFDNMLAKLQKPAI